MSYYFYLLETLTLSPIDPVMIVVCMGLFLVFWKVIEREFFQYYLPLFEERLSATEGAITQAAGLNATALKLQQQVHLTLTQARNEALQWRELQIAEAKQRAERDFAVVEARMLAELKEAQARLKRDEEKITAELVSKIPSLVDSAVSVLVN